MDSPTPSPQDLICQQPSCPARLPARPTQQATDERGRVGGWRIWDGPTEGGRRQRLVACPDCARSQRQPKQQVQDYDQPLWGGTYDDAA